MWQKLKQNSNFQFFLLCLSASCYVGTIIIVLTRVYFGVLDTLDSLVIGLFFILGVFSSFESFLKDFGKWIKKD